ncbi:hypothetical protein MLD38_010742 [Melastoma candidum]|uniref:Uncharacterized protein n=1 Tax=Melastoma candidum TaxID=119954 RepID=A0ACB9R0F3_9MYRT|nr:hypothetical protein MLD38_010742 [Melastoma candidum]
MFLFCLLLKKSKPKGKNGTIPQVVRIPNDSDEVKEIRIDKVSANNHATHEGVLRAFSDKFGDKDSEKAFTGSKNEDDISQSESFINLEKDNTIGSRSSSHTIAAPSPLLGLPEFSHLGWGHWFTLRDLEIATDRFSEANIIGEGGYGIVYRGNLINGTPVAIKKLLNNLGQAKKEFTFTVEVGAIGHVRHKNLVRLLGYCIEGPHRLLVYEYVNNGNLEQWLHRAMRHRGFPDLGETLKVSLVFTSTIRVSNRSSDNEPSAFTSTIRVSNRSSDNNPPPLTSTFRVSNRSSGNSSPPSTLPRVDHHSFGIHVRLSTRPYPVHQAQQLSSATRGAQAYSVPPSSLL